MKAKRLTGMMIWAAAIIVAAAAAAIAFPLAAHEQKFKILYAFHLPPDGNRPSGVMARDTAGNLYGTTMYGGGSGCYSPTGCGVIFELDKAGVENVLHSFAGDPDGEFPNAVIRDAAGNLYGTTSAGGANTWGTVFKLNTSGKETILYNFTPRDGGAVPLSGLIMDSAGNLYGTTLNGGTGPCSSFAPGCGTVFKCDTSGKETVLYSFQGVPDAEFPYGDLIQDAEGNFYGTTGYGGTSNQGTVFKLDVTGKETVLYSFTSVPDGANPHAGLIHDQAGNLYGTTLTGGTGQCDSEPLGTGCGTVFKLDTTGHESVLYSFRGGLDGTGPLPVWSGMQRAISTAPQLRVAPFMPGRYSCWIRRETKPSYTPSLENQMVPNPMAV